MYSLRAVKNIVLRKGGKDVTFITYAPFNKIRYFDTPLKNVNKRDAPYHQSRKDMASKLMQMS